jgi:molybdenum cofactor biosynthesis protein B|tara:strand:+ start:815 stop:1348 length:534 start_codon:yes stop_codon:yes gene_type:complete
MTGLLMKQQNFLPLRISVLVVSDTRTEETDTSGKIFAERLTEEGHSLAEKCIVPDDIYQIRAVLSRWIVDPAVDIILTTGGTGLTGRDGTPEAVIPLFDKVIEGFGEMFRQISYDEISTSTIQSRVTAGVANGTYIFCLPGSSGACRTGWDKILSTQLDIRSRPCNFAEMLPRLTEQ